MKKKIYLLFLICIIFLCSGCQGNITRDIRHAGFTMGDKFICSRFYPADKEDTNYDKIKYFIGSHIINNDGKIYEVSLGQKFSNDENCREAKTSINVKAIFDNRIVKGTDNKYYYLIASNNVDAYSLVPATDNSYTIYDLLLKDEGVLKVITANSSTGLYYVLKTDGNIYSYTIAKQNYNTPPMITEVSVVYNKDKYDSKIIDFNYAGENLNTFLRTENKVYRMKITNNEKCSKYADVKCDFKMLEEEIFKEYKDVIITYNGSTLITNYEQIFNVAK